MKLVIIEGAGKKETIEKYLGNGYTVFATKGHIRDLPLKQFGVNIKKNFEPKYVTLEDKQDIVDALKSKADIAETILLATDPDREGEAISWHLANILNIDPKQNIRIIFNEISKKAVQNALQQPRSIDINLVDAQQARRVLDRIVGYKLSPVLCKKIQNKLSAGRVQSVTLKLVVDREREIQAFVPKEYWTFFSILCKKENNKEINFKVALHSLDGKKYQISNKDELEQVLNDTKDKIYTVSNVKKSITATKPSPPFVTSTMQQDALNKLGFSLKQTTSIAQKLYEGVNLGGQGKTALVTYIRTDSTRISQDAQISAKEFIKNKYGDKYVPEKFNVYSSKKGAQDAHEAIRPIDINVTPDSIKQYLDSSNYKLYKLIYDRFLASQMTPAQYNTTTVDIDCDKYGFRANGRTLLFDGYTAVYNNIVVDKKSEEDNTVAILPDLDVGDMPNFVEYKYEQKYTKPPARYTEASLVKAMEESGIGRPATYNPTIQILFNRKYVQKDSKQIVPQKLGFDCTDMLIKYFPEVMNLEFTANMEQRLDDIEDGGIEWQSVIKDFWEGLEPKLKDALGDEYTLKEPPVETDIVCDKCGAKMLVRSTRFGSKFLACSAFPKCRNGKDINIDDDGNITVIEKEPLPTTDELCDKCGSPLVYKRGKFGLFLACSNYPACKNIVKDKSQNNFENSILEPLADCPKCSKPLVLKYSKKFANSGPFSACSGYPECKFTHSAPLLAAKCPQCNCNLTKVKQNGVDVYKCSDKKCNFVQQVSN